MSRAVPGLAAGIPVSPMSRGARSKERQGVFRSRGIMPVCRRCGRSCKVLRGSPGTSAKFMCYDQAPESAR